MADDQLALVGAAVAAHRELLPFTARAVPSWPLGLEHQGPWYAFALRDNDETVLTVWRLPGAAEALEVPLPSLRGREPVHEQVFPSELDKWTVNWNDSAGVLRIETDVPAPTARVLRLSSAPKEHL